LLSVVLFFFIVWRVFSRSALLTNIEGLKQWFRLSMKIHSSTQCDNGMDLVVPPIDHICRWVSKKRQEGFVGVRIERVMALFVGSENLD